MKKKQLNQELVTLSLQELHERADSYRRELFAITLNRATAHVSNPAQSREHRKNIARALTHIRNKQAQVRDN